MCKLVFRNLSDSELIRISNAFTTLGSTWNLRAVGLQAGILAHVHSKTPTDRSIGIYLVENAVFAGMTI
jgi:hypothetical protein